MSELLESSHPDLEAIKPGVKVCLNDTDSNKFDNCINTNINLNINNDNNNDDNNSEQKQSQEQSLSLSLKSREEGRVSYIEHTLSSEECAALCHAMDSSHHLSFWNAQGRENNEKARQFRDADTVEVNLPSMASTIWNRISTVFDKTPISIRHDDTEHVRYEMWYIRRRYEMW